MKIDKLILVSIFLLAVLAMGAVSASGDVDDLAVDNETIDEGIADSLEDEDIVSDDFDEPLGNDEKHDVYYEKYISTEALIGGYASAYIGVRHYEDDVDVTGNITMYVDGKKVYDHPVRYYQGGADDEIIDGNLFYYRDISDLTVGNHNIVVRYDGDDNYNAFEIKENFTAYYFQFIIADEMEINYVSFSIDISPNATGRVDLFIDDKKKFSTVLPDDDLQYGYDLKDIGLGSHDYEVVYCEGNYPEIRQKGSFNVTYCFYVSSSDSWIDWEGNVTFEVTLSPDASDEVIVLLNGKTYSIKVNENGAGYIILDDFVLGENNVTFRYQDAKYPLREIVETIRVDPKFDFSYAIPYKSQNHNITLSLPSEAEGYLDVFVAEYGEIKYLLDKIPLVNGRASYCISNRPIGNYYFIFKYEGDYVKIEDRYADIKIVPNVMVPYAVMENEDYNITVSVNDDISGNFTIKIIPMLYDEYGYSELEGWEIYNGTAKNLTFLASDLNLDVGEYGVEIHYSMDGVSDFYNDYFNLGIRDTSRVWNIETDLPTEIDRSGYDRDQCFEFHITNPILCRNGKLSLLINGKEQLSEFDSWYDLSFTFRYLITGINNWTLSYTGDGYYEDTSINGTFNVFGQFYDEEEDDDVVNRIDPDLKISVADIVQGKNAVVTISTDAGFTGNVNVRIGSASYVVEVKNGKGSKSISNLKPGTYEAIATFPETDIFKASVKSVKFNVIKKVDEVKLTLKKVKVKKSAKKLVLSATLKVNGKAVKGKKLTFKFNGKTLKAKTNKKGVAKVTVKKNVLKKLKVGKKVKYQVSYQKTTRKLTAKVKK